MNKKSYTPWPSDVYSSYVNKFNIQIKKCNLLHQSTKEKNHMMILTYAGKIFDKIVWANQG